ncbi:hypothetical protein [Geodermatophilus sp. DSM 44513]|uniref:hypothetical protein n=1 Tax=Geodermatophilus sp. DSM 44513 TaxID=1528104 RepID=UPI001411EF94|nr:hypothetical protein [Geodermatophilus sp. DSM 44513]WNV76179.1 hypothetical protein RTG05_02625 [Geodermatophilus sp. DSM 44513]
MSDPQLDAARAAALRFVAEEAGFAQVTTIDRYGFPVARTMTAFLNEDWSVDLVQRRTHARLAQLRRDPRTLVAWIGGPAPGAANEHPHVFDIGRLPPRGVFVRGTAVFTSAAETVACYSRHVSAQRAQGFTRAPLRDADQVVADLVGVHLEPRRVRLEGFGEGARSFDWTLPAHDLRFPPEHRPQGET